jgi:hypothetical protein
MKRRLVPKAEATGKSEITDCSIGQSVHVAMMMTNSLTPHKEISQSGRLKPLRLSASLAWLVTLCVPKSEGFNWQRKESL